MASCWDLLRVLGDTLGGEDRPHRVLLWGPPGTGKSSWGLSLSDRLGVPSFSVTLTGDTMVQELTGHYVPGPSGFIWQDGPALLAMKQGGVFVVNEIDLASGAVLTALLSILDDKRVCRVFTPVGIVSPKPSFIVVATTNNEPGVLPGPLADRFDVVVKVDSPNPDALDVLSREVRNAVVESYRAAAAGGELALSYRQALAFARFSSLIGEEMAAELVFREKGADFLNAIRIGARK